MWTKNRMVGVFPSNYPTGTIKCDVYEFECLSCQAYVIYIYINSLTKVKHDLTCFNNIFSNNELISNRFAVFVTCTHILTYL